MSTLSASLRERAGDLAAESTVRDDELVPTRELGQLSNGVDDVVLLDLRTRTLATL